MAEKLAKRPPIKITNSRQIDSEGAGSYSVKDAPNLLLRIKPTGTRSWVFRYSSGGKVKELGLGKAASEPKGEERGLKNARDLAADMRKAVRDGLDPRTALPSKHDNRAETFKQYAEKYIKEREAAHKVGERKHRSKKHLAQWGSTLTRYIYPIIGDMLPKDIGYVNIEDIARQRDLAGKAETKYRVIQRVKVVLDEAADAEHAHDRFNPAARFLARKAVRNSGDVAHHAHAPIDAVPAIYAALKAKDATSALCLRWSILAACRSGEARGALWSEIDGDMWAIPASRMKAGKAHSAWLGDEAQAILGIMAERNPKREGRIFPGPQGGLISDVSVNKVLALALRDAGVEGKATVHGFRSCFRTWGGNEHEARFSPEALELCLAHAESNKVRKAYNHADMMKERKRILKAWSDYCAGGSYKDNVVQLKTA